MFQYLMQILKSYFHIKFQGKLSNIWLHTYISRSNQVTLLGRLPFTEEKRSCLLCGLCLTYIKINSHFMLRTAPHIFHLLKICPYYSPLWTRFQHFSTLFELFPDHEHCFLLSINCLYMLLAI